MIKVSKLTSFLTPLIFLFFNSGSMLASPSPKMPWEKAVIQFKLENGEKLQLDMSCPSGKLTEFSLKKGKVSTQSFINKVNTEKFFCSGLQTSYEYEDDSQKKLTGLSFSIDFSKEYTKRELYLYFNLKNFKFEFAKWQTTEPGQMLQVTKIDFDK